MAFRDKYTTDALILKDPDPKKPEKNKIILSNDALAIGELLECLINRMVK